jgi:hypothetical protein
VLGGLSPFLGGGVSPSESEAAPKALTRAIVGVLKGSRFNGGRRMGARSFFRKLDDDALLSSIWNACPPAPNPPIVIPRFLRVSLSDFAFSGFGESLIST